MKCKMALNFTVGVVIGLTLVHAYARWRTNSDINRYLSKFSRELSELVFLESEHKVP
jgi:hypothetical protein